MHMVTRRLIVFSTRLTKSRSCSSPSSLHALHNPYSFSGGSAAAAAPHSLHSHLLLPSASLATSTDDLGSGDDGVERPRTARRPAPNVFDDGPPRSRGHRRDRFGQGDNGARGGIVSEDLFPDFGNDRFPGERARGAPHGRTPGRSAMRREGRDDIGAPRRTSDASRGDYTEDFDAPRQKSQFAKGREPGDDSFAIGDDAAQRRGDGVGDTLLKRLNFGATDGGKKVEEAVEQRPSIPASETSSDSAVDESPPEDADAIFKKMKETGLIPNAVAMLDGLCKDGLVQEAMKLFGLMREKGTIPEVVIYTAVVEGFCKATKFDDAKRIFRKMQKNGIVPNAFSFAVLIQGLTKGGKLDDSVEFCLEMLDSGHSPNAATIIGLVDGICKESGVQQAEAVIQRLRERGFALDEKAIREHMDKKGPFSPMVWEAIFGKKKQRPL